MPSHFTHLMFAEEAIVEALGETGKELLASHGNLLRLGAQGPDIFYHNQRTMPSGLRYGVITHRHGYGTLVENMARETLRLNVSPKSELAAFIFGFATHAPLDRATHPYIGYRAGWVDPERPETKPLFRCHPFLERIIDVLVLRERRGVDLADFDFFTLVHCGNSLPYQVIKTIVKSLNAAYPGISYKSKDRKRVENAYRDAMFFYKLTNHLNPALYKLAFQRDRRDGFSQRRLALLHPPQIPEGCDFLNAGRRMWRHPCDGGESSRATFIELYERSLGEAVKGIRGLFDVIAGKISPEGLAARIGEQSLDSGREHCKPRFADPFPLSEMIDAWYRKIEEELAAR